MNQFSVPMALVDFIPVILFAISSVVLQRDLYNKMSKGAFALFAAGTIDIVAAGALKALYKLLHAAGVCDFKRLNAMFFPVQSLGFLLAGAGIAAMLCCLRMGYLSSRDFTQAYLNRMAEGINVMGQSALLLGPDPSTRPASPGSRRHEKHAGHERRRGYGLVPPLPPGMITCSPAAPRLDEVEQAEKHRVSAGYVDGLARRAFLPLAKITAKRYNQIKQGPLTRPPGRELNFNVVMTLQ